MHKHCYASLVVGSLAMAERNNVGGKKKRASPVDEPVAPPRHPTRPWPEPALRRR